MAEKGCRKTLFTIDLANSQFFLFNLSSIVQDSRFLLIYFLVLSKYWYFLKLN
jgi:hypothetical protein